MVTAILAAALLPWGRMVNVKNYRAVPAQRNVFASPRNSQRLQSSPGHARSLTRSLSNVDAMRSPSWHIFNWCAHPLGKPASAFRRAATTGPGITLASGHRSDGPAPAMVRRLGPPCTRVPRGGSIGHRFLTGDRRTFHLSARKFCSDNRDHLKTRPVRLRGKHRLLQLCHASTQAACKSHRFWVLHGVMLKYAYG
jgi:hypothetical protein